VLVVVAVAGVGLLLWRGRELRPQRGGGVAGSQGVPGESPAGWDGGLGGSPARASAEGDFATSARASAILAGDVSKEEVARSIAGLYTVNFAANRTDDPRLRELASDANYAAMRGRTRDEEVELERLIGAGELDEAARIMLDIAGRPGGASNPGPDLTEMYRRAGLAEKREEFRAAMAERSLQTLERMAASGLGVEAPMVFQLTYARAQVYTRAGSVQSRRAAELMAQVARSIPPDSKAQNAGWVRSFGGS
jgi:hypothetical protein